MGFIKLVPNDRVVAEESKQWKGYLNIGAFQFHEKPTALDYLYFQDLTIMHITHLHCLESHTPNAMWDVTRIDKPRMCPDQHHSGRNAFMRFPTVHGSMLISEDLNNEVEGRYRSNTRPGSSYIFSLSFFVRGAVRICLGVTLEVWLRFFLLGQFLISVITSSGARTTPPLFSGGWLDILPVIHTIISFDNCEDRTLLCSWYEASEHRRWALKSQ